MSTVKATAQLEQVRQIASQLSVAIDNIQTKVSGLGAGGAGGQAGVGAGAGISLGTGATGAFAGYDALYAMTGDKINWGTGFRRGMAIASQIISSIEMVVASNYAHDEVAQRNIQKGSALINQLFSTSMTIMTALFMTNPGIGAYAYLGVAIISQVFGWGNVFDDPVPQRSFAKKKEREDIHNTRRGIYGYSKVEVVDGDVYWS